jgi:NAD(P)-dependent dehydrogenase (short-subunit alcohol dehydrogenase family)
LGLAQQGATLGLVARGLGRLESAAEAARAAGAKARVYSADLAEEAEVRKTAAAVTQDFGRVDILVHNAAILNMGSVAEAAAKDFDLHYRTNLRSPYLLTQLLLPLLVKRQGQLVFVNSSAGRRARAKLAQYAATKHALKAIADSLREEVNSLGVRVLSIYPGRTATPIQKRLHAAEGRPYRPELLLQPEDVAAVVINALCLPRTAEVTEIKIRSLMNPDQNGSTFTNSPCQSPAHTSSTRQRVLNTWQQACVAEPHDRAAISHMITGGHEK